MEMWASGIAFAVYNSHTQARNFSNRPSLNLLQVTGFRVGTVARDGIIPDLTHSLVFLFALFRLKIPRSA